MTNFEIGKGSAPASERPKEPWSLGLETRAVRRLNVVFLKDIDLRPREEPERAFAARPEFLVNFGIFLTGYLTFCYENDESINKLVLYN